MSKRFNANKNNTGRKPKTPWDAEEVPADCWLRGTLDGDAKDVRLKIIAFDESGVCLVDLSKLELKTDTYANLAEQCEFSTDTKHWYECTKEGLLKKRGPLTYSICLQQAIGRCRSIDKRRRL